MSPQLTFPRARLGSSLGSERRAEDRGKGALHPKVPDPIQSLPPSTAPSFPINTCALFTLSILINHNSRDICCQNCKLHLRLSWRPRARVRGCKGAEGLRGIIWTHPLLLGFGLEGDPGPILWDPSSVAADQKAFPRRLPTPSTLASFCLRINAAVTAAEKSPSGD